MTATGRILRADPGGDGLVILGVDVAATTIATVAAPAWVILAGPADDLAAAVAARYRDRTHRLRGGPS